MAIRQKIGNVLNGVWNVLFNPIATAVTAVGLLIKRKAIARLAGGHLAGALFSIALGVLTMLLLPLGVGSLIGIPALIPFSLGLWPAIGLAVGVTYLANFIFKFLTTVVALRDLQTKDRKMSISIPRIIKIVFLGDTKMPNRRPPDGVPTPSSTSDSAAHATQNESSFFTTARVITSTVNTSSWSKSSFTESDDDASEQNPLLPATDATDATDAAQEAGQKQPPATATATATEATDGPSLSC
jgi:hypothetical protein